MRAYPAVLFVAALMLGSGAVADSAKNKEESLREYREKIGEQEERLQGLLKKENSLLEQLNIYARRIDDLNRESQELDKQRDATEKRMAGATTEMKKFQTKVDGRKADIQDRLRDLYMWGRPGYLRALLASTSMTDFRQRRWFVRRWVEEDQRRISAYYENLEALERERIRLAAEKNTLASLIQKTEKTRKSMEGERKGRKDLLALVSTQKDFYRKSIRELEEASRSLEQLIKTLRRKEVEGDVLFAKMKGKLLFPVKGKLEKKFGTYVDPRVSAKLHHKGIDLRAPKGNMIRAVFDGKVVYADWFVGYGKIIILDHDGGYFTLYAHADRLSKRVGESVTVGDVIAYVGDTGSLKGAYLYFELRHKGISRDPWPWFAR